MRTTLIVLVLAVQVSAGQPPAPAADTPISLTGCIAAIDAGHDRFMLTEPKTRHVFRLASTTWRSMSGWSVRVVGGLLPSPNIAAQAGSIDPAIATMAIVGGIPVGAGDIRRVRTRLARVPAPPTGSCPQQ
jgi:hypothetical protein